MAEEKKRRKGCFRSRISDGGSLIVCRLASDFEIGLQILMAEDEPGRWKLVKVKEPRKQREEAKE